MKKTDLENFIKRLDSTCKCKGFKFFWGSEIRGYKGNYYDQVRCRDCSQLSLWTRWCYTALNYKSNDQIKE